MYSRDSNIMRKLLGRGTSNVAIDSAAATTSSSSTTSPSDPLVISESNGSTESSLELARGQLAAPRLTKHAQDATYVAAAPILNIDVSPDGRFLAMSGRHILRTIRVDRTAFSDDVDLRGVITSMKGGKGSAISDQLSIQDVKWFDNSSVFTACASGKIYYYDLVASRANQVFAPQFFHDNTRQVTALDVSPHRRSWVLSGSQDGIVRVWDVRTPSTPTRGRPNFQLNLSRRIQGHSESIRSIRWSPRDGFDFAFATESGTIFKADMRATNAVPRMRINAHEGACSSISWHPDGVHLLSGGMDNKLHVWDMYSTDKRQRPKWAIHCPAPIGQALWRPSLWSATDQGRRAVQIAVTYDASSQRRHGRSMVHIWDLGRPTLPYKIVERFDSAPTALLWRDQDVLWAAGQDGTLQQCDVAFAPRVLDRQSMSAFAFAPKGEMIMFLDKRAPSVNKMRMGPGEKKNGTQSMGLSPKQTPMMSIGRSDSDEDLTGTFLNPRAPTLGKARRGSIRGSSSGVTPVGTNSHSDGQPYKLMTSPHQDTQAMTLEESMQATGEFTLTQGMAYAPTPARTEPDMYQYLTFRYLTSLQNGLPAKGDNPPPLNERIAAILADYATVAQGAGLFRLAQSWLILRHVVQILLETRAEYHFQTRMSQERRIISKANVAAAASGKSVRSAKSGENLQGRESLGPVNPGNSLFPDGSSAGKQSELRTSARSLLSEKIENTSAMTTPGMGVSDLKSNEHTAISGTPLSPVLEASLHALALPRPITSTSVSPGGGGLSRLNHPPLSGSPQSYPYVPFHFHTLSAASHQNSDIHASTEGYDFFGAPGEGLTAGGGSDSIGVLGYTVSSSNLTRNYAGLLMPMRTDSNESKTGSPIEERSRQPKNWGMSQSGESPEEDFTGSQITTGRMLVLESREYAPSEADTIEMTLTTRQPVLPKLNVPVLTPLEKAMTSSSATIIDYDYLPWAEDPPFPFPIVHTTASDTLGYRDPSAQPPIDPYAIISSTLAYETRKSPVTAAAIILLLAPLVPPSIIDPLHTEAILRTHHARLLSMRHHIEAAQLRNLCTENWVPGLPGFAANYPSIFTAAQKDSTVHFLCPFCQKPREIDRSLGPSALWTCDRCHRTLDPCAVCKHRHVVADLLNEATRGLNPKHATTSGSPGEPVLTTWWYCHGCGHGGHANCLQAWHYPVATTTEGELPEELSGGFCPQAGCDHACLPREVKEEVMPEEQDRSRGRKFPYVERAIPKRPGSRGVDERDRDRDRDRDAEAEKEKERSRLAGHGVLAGQKARVKFDGRQTPVPQRW